MIININDDNRVEWYNKILTEQQAQQYLNDNTYYIKDLEVPEHEEIEGKQAILYFSVERGFYYEYESDIAQIEEQAQSDTEIIMQAMTDLELANIEAQQERQMLAQQLSDLELALLEGGVYNV